MRVLGIDPGSQTTGFAIVDQCQNKPVYVDSGVIKLKGELPLRLHQLALAIDELIQEYQPQTAAVESTFMHKNVKSLSVLCHARGVILQNIFKNQIVINEYAPRLVKQTIVGNGAAKKSQVNFMVRAILGIEYELAEDAADAVAIAMTHIHSRMELINDRVY